MDRGARIAVVLAVLVVPLSARADFRCEQSVQAHAHWCASSQITSIPPRDGSAICHDFTQRLESQCRSDWDKFKSCQEFAARFEKLLVSACAARKLPRQACRNWGEAFLVGPLNRCQRGHFSY